MKILITGGGGYIGSLLTEDFLRNGYSVTVVDNFMYNQNSLAHLCSFKNLSIINSDIRNLNNFKKNLQTADIIIPLAALVGAPICSYDPVNSKSINYDAQLAIFSLLSNNQKILMPTTNSAYGSGDDDNFCDENTNLNPISSYAKEKVQLEKILMNRTNTTSFRLATVFGSSSRMRTDLLVNDFVLKAYKDNYIVLFEHNFKRNYIHIRDVSRAFNFAIENYDKFNGQIFNVGLSDANISKIELCNLIKVYIKNFSILTDNINEDPDKRNYIVSNKKLEKTGFKTKYSLDFGIQELIKLYSSIKDYKYRNI